MRVLPSNMPSRELLNPSIHGLMAREQMRMMTQEGVVWGPDMCLAVVALSTISGKMDMLPHNVVFQPNQMTQLVRAIVGDTTCNLEIVPPAFELIVAGLVHDWLAQFLVQPNPQGEIFLEPDIWVVWADEMLHITQRTPNNHPQAVPPGSAVQPTPNEQTPFALCAVTTSSA